MHQTACQFRCAEISWPLFCAETYDSVYNHMLLSFARPTEQQKALEYHDNQVLGMATIYMALLQFLKPQWLNMEM